MKNIYTITLLASALQTAFADDLPPMDTKDKTITVTANRSMQNATNALAAIEVLSRQDIEKINPVSVTDLLETFSGIDVTRSGGHGQASSVYTRGGNNGHTLILIDGVRVGSATLGVKEINAIPVALIERIEFVKGPRASLWGSDAISGVIQIFTRRLGHQEYQVNLTAGSHHAQSGHLAVGFGNEKIQNTITVSSEASEGFDVLQSAEPDDDGYRRVAAAIKGDYSLSNVLALDWTLRHTRGNSEYDNAYGGSNESDFENTLLNIRYIYQENDWNSELAVRHSLDHSIDYGNGITRAMAGIFETERNQASGSIGRKINDHWQLTGGLEWFEDKVAQSSTNYATTERFTNSAFINSIFQVARFSSEISLRYDDVENVDTETTYNLSLGYRPNEHWLVAVSTAEAFKAPTFNDLYYPSGLYSSGNPLLKPEYAKSNELLVKWNNADTRLSISVYDNDIDDLIDWQADANFFYQPVNVNSATIKGTDISVDFQQNNFNHRIAATYVDAKDNESNRQLNRRAKQLASYQITYNQSQLEWFAIVKYTGERPDGAVMLDSYSSIDIGLNYQISHRLAMQLKINNLSDEDIQSLNNYTPIQREAYLTVTYANF
ncbi:TonB-dependent receptor domain-containing protein [Pleionea litopenaei]|uniref:TonB-dependent receptor n=1 Tax=Pleionea litopenaei TaxID=3070815 RepID=A0AA51RRD9_9GAMM|nr:TonB-dependent receptor [Pleionea sp. HL-JVS1]WMS86074.1 TonB-dependent receptor [Pleionea sp. HL-JVS1]